MIQKLIANIKKTNAPIVVGLDPMLSYIPEQVKAAAFKEYGETLEGAAEAVWQYNKAIVDEVYDLIPEFRTAHTSQSAASLPGSDHILHLQSPYCTAIQPRPHLPASRHIP